MRTSWLEVKISMMQYALAILLGLFIVPLGLIVLIGGIKSSSVKGLAIGFLLLAFYILILWFIWRGLRKSVKYFTTEGVERRDGRNFAWAEMKELIDRVSSRRGLWRTEFHFKDGETAWLMWSYVGNRDEVESYVNGLPYEHTQKGEFD